MAKVLLALQGGNPFEKRRRQQQCFLSFLNYISLTEWQQMERHGKDIRIVAQIVFSAVIDRLGCVNPTEPTKKFVSSLCLFVTSHAQGGSYNSASHDDKCKTLRMVKKEWKRHVKALLRSDFEIPAADYLVELPPDPASLKSSHPHLYTKFNVRGTWMKAPLNLLVRLSVMEGSISVLILFHPIGFSTHLHEFTFICTNQQPFFLNPILISIDSALILCNSCDLH